MSVHELNWSVVAVAPVNAATLASLPNWAFTSASLMANGTQSEFQLPAEKVRLRCTSALPVVPMDGAE